LIHKHCQNCNGNNEPYIPSQDEKNIDQTSSSLTALIIKWLEGKKAKNYKTTHPSLHIRMPNGGYNVIDIKFNKGRNQLITELIGEIK